MILLLLPNRNAWPDIGESSCIRRKRLTKIGLARHPMKRLLLVGVALAAPLLRHATSTIDATNRYAWGANIGWTNWLPSAADGVVVTEYVCSGYVYAANVGWINFGSGNPLNHIQYQNNSATDFGVNYSIDPT